MAEKTSWAELIGSFTIAAMYIFIAPIIGVLAGAFVGWVTSIMAPVWVPTGLKFVYINVTPDRLVELGAALGFLGGFFRVNRNSKKD